MKTHHVVLVLFSLLLFACPSSDDDNNDDSSVVLTNENNLYEGDLFRTSLLNEKEDTEAAIAQLQLDLIDDPDNEEWLADLASQQSRLNILNAKCTNQDDADEVVRLVPRRPRVPPMPCTSGACIPNILDYITISPDIKSVTFVFRDPQTEEVIDNVSINQLSPLALYGNAVSAGEVNFGDFIGIASVTIERTYLNDEVDPYTMFVEISE